MGLREDIQVQWRTGGMLVRLILVNVGVFLGLHLIGLVLWLFGLGNVDVLYWLKSTSDLSKLIQRPWSVVTYMFLHEGLLHILFNMIVLWFAGRIFQDLLGPKRLLGNYLLGGLFGLALYIISYNSFPVFQRYAEGSTILGASAAVMGVFIGIAAYRPELVVHLILLGPVRLKYIALIYVIIDLVSVRQGVNSGGHIAHLGGALYGFLAAQQLRKGRDWSLGLVNGLEQGLDLARGRRSGRMKVTHRGSRTKPKVPTREKDQDRVDRILDKISKSGYDSLSKEEKDILFRASHEG
ncbi:MAG: rhomboid family intramembrane serine protease [Flavobacteriales bacterium]|nr:rhomboid family intramembrane serine protease [Flavobacteriales bacterium]